MTVRADHLALLDLCEDDSPAWNLFAPSMLHGRQRFWRPSRRPRAR